mgnify:CR=1 FL=1
MFDIFYILFIIKSIGGGKTIQYAGELVSLYAGKTIQLRVTSYEFKDKTHLIKFFNFTTPRKLPVSSALLFNAFFEDKQVNAY